jgi:hypothetical protein
MVGLIGPPGGLRLPAFSQATVLKIAATNTKPVKYVVRLLIVRSFQVRCFCRSYGLTLDEALRNISEAAALCLEDEQPEAQGTFVGVRDLEIVA